MRIIQGLLLIGIIALLGTFFLGSKVKERTMELKIDKEKIAMMKEGNLNHIKMTEDSLYFVKDNTHKAFIPKSTARMKNSLHIYEGKFNEKANFDGIVKIVDEETLMITYKEYSQLKSNFSVTKVNSFISEMLNLNNHKIQTALQKMNEFDETEKLSTWS